MFANLKQCIMQVQMIHFSDIHQICNLQEHLKGISGVLLLNLTASNDFEPMKLTINLMMSLMIQCNHINILNLAYWKHAHHGEYSLWTLHFFTCPENGLLHSIYMLLYCNSLNPQSWKWKNKQTNKNRKKPRSCSWSRGKPHKDVRTNTDAPVFKARTYWSVNRYHK